MSNCYQAMYNGESIGRFAGTEPKQAASKALTTILRKYPSDGNKFEFSVVHEDSLEQFKFSGERKLLDEPQIVKLPNNKEITYKYMNRIKLMSDEQSEDELSEDSDLID